MMKKLLALILVLGLVSVASAGFQIIAPASMEPSDVAIIQVVSDTDEIGGFAGGLAIDIASGPGSWTGVYNAPGMPDPMNANNFLEYYGDVTDILGVPLDLFYMDLTSPVTTPFPPQVWFEAEFHCDGIGPVDIVLTNFDLVEIGRVTIMQTPEPATMFLLGLGGLFLRRRK